MKKVISFISFLTAIILVGSLTSCKYFTSTEDDPLAEIMADGQMTYEEAIGEDSKPIKKEKVDSEIGIRSLGINYENDGFSDIQNLTYFHSFGECFEISNALYSDLISNSQILDGTQVRFYNATIFKVIKSNSKNFELLVCLEENWDGNNQEYYNAVTNEEFLYVRGNYPEGNEYEYQKGGSVGFCGKYIDIKNYEIDGKKYNIPGIMAYCEYSPTGDFCDVVLGHEESKRITKYIFGETAVCEYIGDGHFEPTPQVMINNAKAPIKNLYISEDRYTPAGSLFATEEYLTKMLLYTADAETFLIITYNHDDSGTSVMCYDKEWNLIWNNTISAIVPLNGYDLTNKNFYCVAGNVLYAFKLSTGEYLYEPLDVGEKSILRKTESGVLTIDTSLGKIVYANSKGEIEWTDSAYFHDLSKIQIINDKAIMGKGIDDRADNREWKSVCIDCKNKKIS